ADSLREAGLQPLVFRFVRRIRMAPIMQVINRRDFCLQHLFSATETGPHRGVHCAALNGNSKPRSGQNRILLCMHADAEVVARPGRVFIPIRATVASSVQAIWHVFRRAIVSSGNDSPLLYDYRADAAPQAIGPFSDSYRDSHEVLVRIRPAIFFQAHAVTSLVCADFRQTPKSILSMLNNSRT